MAGKPGQKNLRPLLLLRRPTDPLCPPCPSSRMVPSACSTANYTGTSNSNGTPTQFRHSSRWLSRLQVLSIMVAIGLRLAEETLVHRRGRRLELQLGWVDINNLLVTESN